MTNDPYDKLPDAPSFRVTSTDATDAKEMPRDNVSESLGGRNISPQLSWYGFPKETRSLVVTMYDADAPTPSGFWHWAVVDIPAGAGELPRGAGSGGGSAGEGASSPSERAATLPAGARHLRNDAGMPGYLGPAPPPGHGRHRYFIAVHAVDVDSLGLGDDATPAYLSFVLLGHTLGRAIMVPWAEARAEEQAA